MSILYRANTQDVGNRYDSFYKPEKERPLLRLYKFYQSLLPLTREVCFELDKSSVYSGKALERLLHAPLNTWNFQEDYKIKFEFYVPDWQQEAWDYENSERSEALDQANTKSDYYDWLDERRDEITKHQLAIAPKVKANISKFVCQIKQLAPMLRKVE
ncbi:hypothetical protein IWW39_006174, partial [Coemansia spiralis]